MYATDLHRTKSLNGQFSKMRIHLQPRPPIPINYASAAVPTYAPYGTEYTPAQQIKIIGGRRIPIPVTVINPASTYGEYYDPAIAPTKPIQQIVANDNSRWQEPTKPRFDTTYRTEYINRFRNQQEQYTKPTREFKNALNQYSVLPPISSSLNRTNASDRKSVSDGQATNPDQEVPGNETMPSSNYNNDPGYYEQQQQQQQQPMMDNQDTYLPEEPVLLTDFEEERLAEQVRLQIGGSGAVDRLKLFYQELGGYDPNGTGYVHYSSIQTLAYQLGLNFAEDTLRFAMCKFVSPDRGRGNVNYEDLIRFLGKCISSVYPNQYGNQQQQQSEQVNSQRDTRPSVSNKPTNNDDAVFDPDERQIRILLKQTLQNFDLTGAIDFDRLVRELNVVDRNQSGILNRQQIEEVVYRVRIPLQRSLIYQILEKHCRAYAKLYNWRAFVQYLKEQIFDLKQIQDQTSPVYAQYVPSRIQWLDDLQREFHERDRLRVIDRFVTNNAGVRVESTHPTAWFTRFLRLANAMYTHRTNSNVSQDFLLPREEARRLFRAYNHVWDLKIDENRLEKVFESCARNGRVVINDAFKQLAN